MKYSLGISDILEEISSLSYSVVFLSFFALITEEGFLFLRAILWNSAFKWVYLSFSPLTLASLLFMLFVRPPQKTILPFCMSFSWGWCWSLPAMQETGVWSLGQEDPLEKEMATHSSTLAWKIPWMEEPAGLQPMGSQRVRHDWVTSLHFLWDWNKNWPFTVLWPLLSFPNLLAYWVHHFLSTIF